MVVVHTYIRKLKVRGSVAGRPMNKGKAFNNNPSLLFFLEQGERVLLL